MAENNTECLVAGAEGVLSMVGTPIGNLGDLTPRAAQAFRDADVICCEDTRVTSKLLAYLGISKPLVRCDENVIARRAPELVERLLAGERIAFASDAGMPGVSDPGQVLVDAAREAGARVEVLPGPSACVTALVLWQYLFEHARYRIARIACDVLFFPLCLCAAPFPTSMPKVAGETIPWRHISRAAR